MAAMSPRAPLGVSNQCPLCRSTLAGESPTADGELPCPGCGGRLWLLNTTAGRRYHQAERVGPIRERVIDVVEGKFPEARGHLTGTTTFEDLGADSLDVAEVIMEIEQEFDLTIDDEEANHLRCINDLIDYILWRWTDGATASV